MQETAACGEHGKGFQGRRWDSGEDIVSPYLWSLGLKKIDVVALTQAHSDRIDGLLAVIENFHVDEFWYVPQAETPEYTAFMDALAERGIPTRMLMAGDELSQGDARIRVLWPEPGSESAVPHFSPASERAAQKAGAASASHSGDDSLVMRLSEGGMNFLLAGDADRDAEKGILASGEPLESQVLNVGLHGSKASTGRDYLMRVAPHVAIVSSEAGSRVGDTPNPQMLRALESAGARVFRTATDGATTVEWDGSTLVVCTYRGLEAVAMRRAAGPPLSR